MGPVIVLEDQVKLQIRNSVLFRCLEKNFVRFLFLNGEQGAEGFITHTIVTKSGDDHVFCHFYEIKPTSNRTQPLCPLPFP